MKYGGEDQKIEQSVEEDAIDQMDLFGQKKRKQETLMEDDEWQNKFYDPLIGAEEGSDQFKDQISMGHCGFYEVIEE